MIREIAVNTSKKKKRKGEQMRHRENIDNH